MASEQITFENVQRMKDRVFRYFDRHFDFGPLLHGTGKHQPLGILYAPKNAQSMRLPGLSGYQHSTLLPGTQVTLLEERGPSEILIPSVAQASRVVVERASTVRMLKHLMRPHTRRVYQASQATGRPQDTAIPGGQGRRVQLPDPVHLVSLPQDKSADGLWCLIDPDQYTPPSIKVSFELAQRDRKGSPYLAYKAYVTARSNGIAFDTMKACLEKLTGSGFSASKPETQAGREGAAKSGNPPPARRAEGV